MDPQDAVFRALADPTRREVLDLLFEHDGRTVGELLADLDRRFPGLRFRIVDETSRLRAHIKLFVNDRPAGDLAQSLEPGDRVHIVAALSGG